MLLIVTSEKRDKTFCRDLTGNNLHNFYDGMVSSGSYLIVGVLKA